MYSHPNRGVETNTHIVLKALRVICGISCPLRDVLSHKFKLYFLALCGYEKKFGILLWRGGKTEEQRGQRLFLKLDTNSGGL